MVYGIKETAVNRPIVIWWGGEVFCRPMIRSQSFSEPVILDCDLHKCYSVLVFSFPFGGIGWLE